MRYWFMLWTFVKYKNSNNNNNNNNNDNGTDDELIFNATGFTMEISGFSAKMKVLNSTMTFTNMRRR